MEKVFEIYRGKKERVKSIALKAKKESSDYETLTFESDDEEYAMAVRNFKKFFRRKDQKAFIEGSWSDSENDAEDKTNNETCLIAQSSNEVCLRTCLEPDEWIKDSGCSKHMTGNKSLYSTYKAYDEEHVDNLAFNLLRVGQICDNKCQVFFTEEGSEITKDEDRIFFNQPKYIKEMLKKFRLEDSKPTKMPMSTEIKLTKEDEADFMDSSKY
uniref:Integrase, catalytic region, zinc finger, CCHC-type, peptidase aspartic, catalytic n=1 Tax=Tanacetum cinerariifolium TaxID=118510 RepID=A0A699IPQ3_TANCI|nr:integrase, catalytic region, zinc finger, CCHC-type, peptidase aspartic, catalytic [Tanacetum cinerariifolium]